MAFHRTVIAALADTVRRAARGHGIGQVALSGGAFQNRLLAEGLERALARAGLHVYRHRRRPPNDGSISFGQAVVAAEMIK